MLSSVCTAEGFVELRRAANLYSAPSSSSLVLGRMRAGTELIEIGGGSKQKGYWRVQNNSGLEGFVYQTLGKYTPYVPNLIYSQSDCDVHLPYGLPTTPDQLICRLGYVVGYSYQYNIPTWVAYRADLDSANTNGAVRQDDFVVDLAVAEQNHRVGESVYENTGYDKAHMAPPSLIDKTQLLNDQTFLMTNITPQRPWFNRDVFGNKGVWGAIEDSVACWLKTGERKEIYVISGAIVSDTPEYLGELVAIPSGFYKIILDMESLHSIAFYIEDQEASVNDALNLPDYITTIDAIEAASGINVLNTLQDPIENLVEASIGLISDWPLYDRHKSLGCVVRPAQGQ